MNYLNRHTRVYRPLTPDRNKQNVNFANRLSSFAFYFVPQITQMNHPHPVNFNNKDGIFTPKFSLFIIMERANANDRNPQQFVFAGAVYHPLHATHLTNLVVVKMVMGNRDNISRNFGRSEEH